MSMLQKLLKNTLCPFLRVSFVALNAFVFHHLPAQYFSRGFCCLLNAVTSSSSPSFVSFTCSQASTFFQSHFFFVGFYSIPISIFSLLADWGRWGQLLFGAGNVCEHVLFSEEQAKLNCHLWGSLAWLMQGSFHVRVLTESCSLRFWVRDVSCGYQGNF